MSVPEGLGRGGRRGALPIEAWDTDSHTQDPAMETVFGTGSLLFMTRFTIWLVSMLFTTMFTKQP